MLVDNQVDPQNHKMLMHMPEGLTCLVRQECGIRRQASCKVNGIFAKLLCISVCALVPTGTTAAAVIAWQDLKAGNVVMGCMSC